MELEEDDHEDDGPATASSSKSPPPPKASSSSASSPANTSSSLASPPPAKASSSSSSASPPPAKASATGPPEERFDIVELPGKYYESRNGQKLGRIHIVGDGSCKATCGRHGCVCWLNKHVEKEAAISILVDWLSMKHGPADHRAAAVDVKKSVGMRVLG
jgi:hypothetical protein